MTAAALHIAIIGAGPAGAYVAERLLRQNPAACVDVIDRLVTPFGLIRYGVAPDHQGTKNIERVLSRALSKGDVQFWGGVTVGVDLSLAELQHNYDAVVLAIGAPLDRHLEIPGEDLSGVYGSAAFVGWYNRHPDHFDLQVDLAGAKKAMIIGAGNVALDVARVLGKSTAELAGSDLSPDVSQQLAAASWETLRVIARRGLEMARFGLPELDEMTRLANASARVDRADLDSAEITDLARAEIFARMAAETAPGNPLIQFDFAWRPEEIIGTNGHVSSVRFRRQKRDNNGAYIDTDYTIEHAADLVVSCIGYQPAVCDHLQPTEGCFANTAGLIDVGLYVVGWAADGPNGTIATNRPKSHALADRILAEVSASDKRGRRFLAAVLQERRISAVDFEGWQAIDTAERAAAAPDRVRLKQLPGSSAPF